MLRQDVDGLEAVPQAVMALVNHARTLAQMDESRCYCVRLVLQELMVNACRYGGTGKASAWIRVDAGRLDIMVMDDGAGFVIDPAVQAGGLLDESGRGLFLVREFCQGNMRQNRSGNCIRVWLHN